MERREGKGSGGGIVDKGMKGKGDCWRWKGKKAGLEKGNGRRVGKEKKGSWKGMRRDIYVK